MTGSQRVLTIRLKLARAALVWERAWPAAWPALCVLGSFAVVALFDLLPLFPGPAHAGALGAFAVALLAAAGWAVWSVGWPDRLAARRRIEQSSGLPHRPLQALSDRPAAAMDRGAVLLWAAHQRRMAMAVRRLRVGWPSAGLARRDPWGVRSVLVTLLLVGAIDAGADWHDRVFRALHPSFAAGTGAIAASFDIWITPPEYTGLAPQFLRADNTETISVPTGSVLLAQVHGGKSVPRLKIDQDTHAFEAVDKQNFRASATLTAGTSLSVIQGGASLGTWPIAIVPDKLPVIAFTQPPTATARAALRLDYRASDDYGIESVKAMIRRPDGEPATAMEIDLPMPGLRPKEGEGTSYHDLTPHPWAGLPVELRLAATDALGQTGHGEPVRMNLPERVFNNPMARAIIDQRKELVKDPASRAPVAEILGDLNQRPALYRDDTVVFMALSFAQHRLRRDDTQAGIDAVVQLLWDTALRIEDGNMSLAERELRRLQQALQEALAKGAPDAEIDQLMRELREALDRYLQALAEDMRRNPSEATAPSERSRMMTSRDLQRMLDRARDLARSGARDQARDMLSQLQNMLENLRAARPGEGRQRGNSEAQRMMRGMQEMMQRQQQLLDRSFRAQRQREQQGSQGQRAPQPGEESDEPGQMGEMGEMGEGEMGEDAGQQEALRRMLGDMMREMGDGAGEIPDPFGRAERAMRDAAGALQRGRPGDAIAPQSQALDQLQQAARDFAQRMQKRLGNSWGEVGDGEVSPTDRRMREQMERDPFGRPLSSSGTYDQSDVEIPEQNTLQKARKILDELRRRAGERFRPTIELDYIDRLLKRF